MIKSNGFRLGYNILHPFPTQISHGYRLHRTQKLGWEKLGKGIFPPWDLSNQAVHPLR